MIVATGALVGIAAALPGTFLVLRGSAMLTDAISHSILLGIFVVWWLSGATSGPLQLAGAALAGLAAVALIELVARSRLVRMDAAIGLVFPAFFALGVLLISLFARDVHLDEHAVLWARSASSGSTRCASAASTGRARWSPSPRWR
jgi:manganese/zinc/iron transport system permease protein